MKKFLAILIVLCAFKVNAQVMQVSGNQSGTWSGEVHLVDDVIVKHGDTLTILPGTVVLSDKYFEIKVNGNLYAEGDEKERITFTVADTTGYSNYEFPQRGGWKGISIAKTKDVRFKYCDFSYGKTEVDGDGGAMRVNDAEKIVIANCRFHHNTMRKRGGGLFAVNSTLNIYECEIYENFGTGYEGSYCWGTGFQFLKCDVTMNDVVFHDNYSDVGYGGGMNVDSCNMELNNAVFYNNVAVNAGGLGIQRCKEYSVKVSNMLAYNNAVRHYGGGLAMATSDPELNNLTIVNNYCGGGGGAGMQAAFDAAPTLNNCIFWGNHAIYGFNNDNDTLEYYYGSQIWLWGSDNRPVFNNGVVQYGMDSINGHEYMVPEQYNDMLEVDPLFVDIKRFDYHLIEKSPCINRGTADIAGLFLPDSDLDGSPRVFDGRIDMGCYEWNNIGVDEFSAEGNSMSVYPNPLNDNAFCVVNLNKKSDVVLKLISLDGKEVYRENCGTLEAGENRIPLYRMMKNVERGNKMYLLIIDNQSVKIIY